MVVQTVLYRILRQNIVIYGIFTVFYRNIGNFIDFKVKFTLFLKITPLYTSLEGKAVNTAGKSSILLV